MGKKDNKNKMKIKFKYQEKKKTLERACFLSLLSAM